MSTDANLEVTAKRESAAISLSDKIALRVDEACAVAGFRRTKFYELINSGELRSIRRAGRRLVLRTDLEQFLTGEAV